MADRTRCQIAIWRELAALWRLPGGELHKAARQQNNPHQKDEMTTEIELTRVLAAFTASEDATRGVRDPIVGCRLRRPCLNHNEMVLATRPWNRSAIRALFSPSSRLSTIILVTGVHHIMEPHSSAAVVHGGRPVRCAASTTRAPEVRLARSSSPFPRSHDI
jgi:hypothetical protein